MKDLTDPRWIKLKRLLFGRPISLDVLGIAPIDRLGQLSWLGPSSVVVFGLVLGLVANAFSLVRFDRWMLLLTLGTFTGAYPLMYFAQEFIPLYTAIIGSAMLVLAVVGLRSMTIIGFRLGLLGVVVPAAAILGLTLLAAINTRLQGILITATGIALFIVAMVLIPRIKIEGPLTAAKLPAPVGPKNPQPPAEPAASQSRLAANEAGPRIRERRLSRLPHRVERSLTCRPGKN